MCKNNITSAILENMANTETRSISLSLDNGKKLCGYPLGYDMNEKGVYIDFHEKKTQKTLKIKLNTIKKLSQK